MNLLVKLEGQIFLIIRPWFLIWFIYFYIYCQWLIWSACSGFRSWVSCTPLYVYFLLSWNTVMKMWMNIDCYRFGRHGYLNFFMIASAVMLSGWFRWILVICYTQFIVWNLYYYTSIFAISMHGLRCRRSLPPNRGQLEKLINSFF